MEQFTQDQIKQLVSLLHSHGIFAKIDQEIVVHINAEKPFYFGEIKITKSDVNILLLLSHLSLYAGKIGKKLAKILTAYLMPKYHPPMSLEQALPIAFNTLFSNAYVGLFNSPHDVKVVRFVEDDNGTVLDKYTCPLSKYFASNEKVDEDTLDTIAYENMRESSNYDFKIIGCSEDDEPVVTDETEIMFYIDSPLAYITSTKTAKELGFNGDQDRFLTYLYDDIRMWRNERIECGWEITDPFILIE